MQIRPCQSSDARFVVRVGLALLVIAGALATVLANAAAASPGIDDAAPIGGAAANPVLRIEAEDFEVDDPGADDHDVDDPGAAYFDTDPAMGNTRLDESVDVWVIDNVGASGGLIGRTRAGEYTRYTFDLYEGGTFAVRLAIASGSATAGAIDVDVDGQVVGSVRAEPNGKWFGWAAQRAGVIDLAAGRHTITTTWRDGANINFDWLDLVSAKPSAPQCPLDRVEAESGRVAGRFRIVEDLNASGSAYVAVPHGAGGSWNGATDSYVELCIGVERTATYRLDARLRTPSARDNSFYVSVDGGPLLEFVAPVTGTAFATAPVGESGALDPLRTTPVVSSAPRSMPVVNSMAWNLERGDHHIRFYVRRDGAQLDELALVAGPPEVKRVGCMIGETHVVSSLGQRECDALVQLYAATGGDSWTTNTGWGTATDPCGWYRVECSESSVTALHLFDTGLTGTIPPELFDLHELRVLDLGGNALTGAIPLGLANLHGLDGLFLDDNDLEGSIPAELGALDELRNLYLSHNKFGGSLTPELGGMVALEYFYATGNRLTGSIPSELGNLSRLRILGLRDNRLSGELPDGLGRLGNLQTLDLYRNRLTGTLPSTFANLRSLTYLSVLENRLSGDITLPMAALRSQLLDAEFADGIGGNNCITVIESAESVRAWLDVTDPGWDRCDVGAAVGVVGVVD